MSAVVTGGTRGLGLAIAKRLAADGSPVGVVYRADEEAAAEAERAGLHAAQADISDPAELERAISEIRRALGPISILINNAFRSGRVPVKSHELELEAWDDDIRTNLSGQFYATRACLPDMVQAKFGRVVFIGSFAQRGEQGRVAYSVAKSGVIGLSNTLAQEYARYGVTSNVVSPGFISTGAFTRLDADIQERALKLVPSRKAGHAKNVAALIAHICSVDGGYLNGQVIGVDGGAR